MKNKQEKKQRGKCVNCPWAEVYPDVTDPMKKRKLVKCKEVPHMKIDIFTHQPDWCPLRTQMQTPIEMPKVPEEIEKLEADGTVIVDENS